MDYTKIKKMKGIILILVASFAVRILLIFVNSFQSDESVYAYAGYAISRGAIPYREISLAHPPFMFLVYSAIIWLGGTSLVNIRLFDIGLFLTTIIQTYIFSWMLLENWEKKERTALIVSAFYGLFPSPFILLSITNLLDILLVFFIMNSCITYMLFRKSNNSIFLFLSGLFMGFSLITTIRAAYFILPMVFYQLASAIWNEHNRRLRTFLNRFTTLFLGGIIPVAISLFLITFVWNALNNFITEVFYFPSIIIKMDFTERVLNILNGLSITLPLTILAFSLIVLYAKREIGKHNVFPMLYIIVLSGIFLISVLPPNIFLQYFFYLTPFVSFMACIGLYETTGRMQKVVDKSSISKVHVKSTVVVLLLILFLSLGAQSLIFMYNVTKIVGSQGPPIKDANLYDQVALNVSRCILNITRSEDKIWTSEGAIAFFSQRLISPPNSSDWPVSCFFADFFGYVPENWFNQTLVYRGDEIKDYHGPILLPEQFSQAWEKNDVKALVFILNNTMATKAPNPDTFNMTTRVPYPDTFIYDGFKDQQGAKSYVQQNYNIIANITVVDNPFRYEIWVRK